MLSRCFLDFSVSVGAFVIGLSQISSLFSNALPTELDGLICRVGFKLLLYSDIYSYNFISCCVMHA